MTTEVVTPPAGTPPAGTPPVGTPPAGTPPAAEWHGYTTPDEVAYVKTKGWQGPQDVVKSYQNAEKLIGRDPNSLLVLPRADDPAGLRATLGKLGRPEKADAYELDLPKGVDGKTDPFAQWSRDTFHKYDLLPHQAKGLSADYNKFLAENMTRADNDYKIKVEADKQALLKEWGGGHERMMIVAKAAAAKLGFDGEFFDAIEERVGYAKTYKMFAELGQKMSEDTLPLGEGKKTFEGALATPAEANAEWARSKLDPNFMAALGDKNHPGHSAAQKKQNDLFAIMYPEK